MNTSGSDTGPIRETLPLPETLPVSSPVSAAMLHEPSNRKRRRVLKGVIWFVSVMLFLVAGVVGYAWFRVAQIPHAAIPKDAGNPPSGPLPTIEIPLDGGTADGKPPLAAAGQANQSGAGVGDSLGVTDSSIADPADGPIVNSGPVATLKPGSVAPVFGPLVDTSGIQTLGGPRAKNYLMIGVDSRSDIPADQRAAFGAVGGSRSDTIMLLRLDPSTNQAWVLSFPRDLYVRIAGTNQFNRLNAAYGHGAGTLTSTLRENFNVPVEHFVVVDFVGFQKVVKAVGGVTICFPKASRDTVTGLNQPAGCNLLDPKQATAYVRSRHFQEGENNVWKEDPRSDLGRIQRQQAFIRATLSQAVDKGMRDPIVLNALLTSMKDAITLDANFGVGDIAGLAADLRTFDPNTLKTFTVPATNRRVNGKDVLILQKEQAAKIIGQFGQRKVAG